MVDDESGSGDEEEPLEPDQLGADPVGAFRDWLAAAHEAGLPEPRAATVATADSAGRPSARTMILRAVDERGFTFFTSHDSRKGAELRANPRVALVFLWQPLHRQITVTGDAMLLDDEEADHCFVDRPRGAQLAAWAARQSSVLPDRATLEHGFADAAERYAGREVPRPPSWGGFRVAPASIEFWRGRTDRLHDRLRYRRSEGRWVLERLGP